MYIDSNKEFLDYRKLWTAKGTLIKSCGNLREVEFVIGHDVTRTNPKVFLINVGVNDLDFSTGEEVFDIIRSLIH